MMLNSLKRQYITALYIGLILFLFYPVLAFDSVNKYNAVNVLLYMISEVIVLYSIVSINNKNINSYNVFLLFYFFALFLNTLNISSKQLLKTEEDLYFFLVGPFVVYVILYFFENLRIYSVKFKYLSKIDVNKFYISIVLLYVSLKLYIGMTVGFRYDTYDDLSIIESSGNDYQISGVSGVSAIMQWLIVILTPYVKRYYSVVGIMSIIILSGVLHIKRGDVMRVFIFILLYFVFIKIQLQQLNKKKILQIIIGIVVLIFIFSQLGEIRVGARGGEAGAIVSYLDSKIDSIYFSWIYGYFSFPFEILKFYYDISPSYNMNHISEIFLGESLTREAMGLNISISGFNASTFLTPFIIDYGYFYFLEIILLPLIAGILICISKKLNFLGLYVFILMIMSLMVFGDFLINRSVFISIIIAILIFPFLRIRNQPIWK